VNAALGRDVIDASSPRRSPGPHMPRIDAKHGKVRGMGNIGMVKTSRMAVTVASGDL